MLIGIDASRVTAAERTGTENYSLYLIRALLRLGQQHNFRLYFREPPPAALFPPNAHVEWRVIPFPRLWTHLRLAWELLYHPVDVLFVPAHVLPLIHPRCAVVTVHDVGYRRYPQAHTRFSYWYLDWSTGFSARHARRILVDSQATQEDLVAYYGISRDKIVVAYPAGIEGLAPIRDPQTLQVARERYGTGRCYFLYVGSLHPRKNLETLIAAFGRLIRERALSPDVRLVLAGRPGWLYEGILAAANSPSLAGRVILPGYIPPEDLSALLSGALAFVYPSLYEGFGLPILEAMACDTPVICSRAAALPEVAGDAALLVDPHDVDALAFALRRMHDDPALREELIRRGRVRCQVFTWTNCARTVLEVLEEVGASKRG